MWTKFGIAVTIAVLCTSVAANAQGFRAGDKEFLLSGSGTSNQDFDSTTLSAAGSLGYFLTDGLEIALRQDFAWTNPENRGQQLGRHDPGRG